MPTLKVRVISGRNCPADAELSVKVKCGEHGKQHKTKGVKKTATPEWNETFSFDDVDANADSVQIELDQSKTFGSAKIGVIVISLKSLQKGKERVTWESEGLGGKGELQIGLLAVDFGLEPPKEKKGMVQTLSVHRSQRFILAVPSQRSILPPMPPAEEVNKLYDELMVRIVQNDINMTCFLFHRESLHDCSGARVCVCVRCAV